MTLDDHYDIQELQAFMQQCERIREVAELCDRINNPPIQTITTTSDHTESNP